MCPSILPSVSLGFVSGTYHKRIDRILPMPWRSVSHNTLLPTLKVKVTTLTQTWTEADLSCSSQNFITSYDYNPKHGGVLSPTLKVNVTILSAVHLPKIVPRSQ